MRVEGARGKMLVLLLILVVFVSVLSGCSKTGVCEECGEETKIVKYTTTLNDEDGEEIWVCEDCLKVIKGLEAFCSEYE